ncbi:MAG TPA: lysylphosphatidylglycerol synthase transmembrane domain-containing protein [Candidatus Bathyarchaeia archaeon]|nr:lysylphosphatidylglycerol synthase transmembrane domain-containing protein [Candidatus Bathyarchaeia archaeon]
MTSPKYKVTWRTFALPLIGLAAFFVYIYIFNVDVQEIIATVQRINLYFYLWATIAVILDTLFFTLAWNVLLRFLSVKIPTFKLFLYVWVGVFVDTLIPAESVSGEITKIYLVNREQTGTAGRATASVVAHRLINMFINIVTLLIGAILLLIENQLYGIMLTLILFIVAVISLFLILIMLLCVKEKWTCRIVDAIIRFAERISRGRWKLVRLREEVIEAAKSFHVAIKEYARAPKTLLVAVFFSVGSLFFSLVVFYLTFLSIGYSQISWSTILVTSAIFVAVKSIPIGIPFEVGLPEITLYTLFIWLGVPGEVSATVTILARLLTLWFRFFIGFVAQQWVGIQTMITRPNDAANKVESEKT